MTLIVIDKRRLTHGVVRLRLGRPDGSELPPFEAGAHLALSVVGMVRQYSITSSPRERLHYEIAVLRVPGGRGGSAFIHDGLGIGDEIDVDGPFNGFGLDGCPPYAVFIAGGIGLTPFYTLIRKALDTGVPCELHYTTRTAADRLPIPKLGPGRLVTYVSREVSNDSAPLDIPGLLQQTRRDAHLYVCGPRRLIESARSTADRLGWPRSAVHVESFGAGVAPGDRPLTVHLDLSGVTIRVEPGGSILQAMLDRGIWANYQCRRGECGSCYVEVTAGEAEHRDVCLTPAQRRAGMCPCVSWATSDELTIRA
ncbi:MAG: PDR/VanB family oxidoreductase [Acidobacteriota bacterium]